ncbi:MAG: sulfate permease-like transporter, superfamily [Marmoricola sp.]|nr:sulfate permease-like transporter, superfamily [Marmoricola sp.]
MSLGDARAKLLRLVPQRADLAKMTHAPRHDLVAGVTVGLVALPLALGFGISSGMGASAGLITAVVAGFIAAVFGGSNLQVSGPTGAMTVVLIPIVAAHGVAGVFVVGVMAGLMLLAMATAGLGRYARHVPLPVVEGFTLGIALVIGLQQLPGALGVKARGTSVLAQAGSAASSWLARPDWAPLLMTAGVVIAMLVVARVRPAWPGSLLAVALATGVAQLAGLQVGRVGTLPDSLPAPRLPSVPWADLGSLILPALAVALLAALESLLSATVADAMSISERHDPDRELFGQGLANLVGPLFGGMPATGAIARTAVNVRSGGRSRLAAITHSVFLLAVILVLGPFISRVPIAALAGVLVATCIRMVEIRSLRSLWRSGRGEAGVLVATVAATVVLDLVEAVLLGVVAAGALALRRAAKAVTVEQVPLQDGDHEDEEHALLDEHIVAYRIDGPLFFAGAHQALLGLASLSDVQVVILRLSRISSIDATGAAVLRDTIIQLERRGIRVLLSGVPAHHSLILGTLGVYDSLAHERHVFATTPDAIAHARMHVARVPHQLA